jgi:hypothetical protein
VARRGLIAPPVPCACLQLRRSTPCRSSAATSKSVHWLRPSTTRGAQHGSRDALP